jgi:hypothetical protein
MAKKKAKPSQQVQLGRVDTVEDAGHGQLIEWVNDADTATEYSRFLSEKGRDYYDSEQWTDEEKKKLKDQKQAATVINRIKPKMDGLMGMERVNKTTAKAFPRTPKHKDAATAVTEAIRFCLQDNAYSDIRSSCWDNIVIEGTAGCEIMVKAKGDDFKITIKHLMWDRLIYDPFSRRKDFSDARFLGQVVWMDYDEALDQYPDGADMLETMMEGSETYADKPRWMDGTRKRVKIVELYYKKHGKVYYACFTRGGYLKAPKISPYVNEEGETEWPYEFASAFVTREGVRYGAVRQLTDIQDEINKRRSKALHLMSVRQVRWERGAVEDINKARQELAKPDGVIETTPGMEFEILKTGDMAGAQFNLLTEAKQEIDAVSFSAAAAGKEERNMSGVALRSREMASQTELAPLFDVLKGLDVRVYRKVWNRIKQYWKAEKWIRVTDEENNLKFVGLNKPMTAGEQLMQKAQQQGLPPEQLQMLAQRVAQDPSMQQIVGTENDIAELDMDIIIDDAPDAVTTQAEDFAVLGEMVKSGFQMPPEAVIEASPLSNKDKILKMMREARTAAVPPQVQEQMQKMQEGAQQLQQELQKVTQENQQLKADMTVEMQKIDASGKAEAAKIMQKGQLAEYEMLLDKQLEIDRAIMDIQSLIVKHEAKMQTMVDGMLTQMQASADKESEKSDEASEMQEAAQEQNTMAAMQMQHQQFMEAIGAILEGLNAKKQITIMRKPDGSVAGAEVTPVTPMTVQ